MNYCRSKCTKLTMDQNAELVLILQLYNRYKELMQNANYQKCFDLSASLKFQHFVLNFWSNRSNFNFGFDILMFIIMHHFLISAIATFWPIFDRLYSISDFNISRIKISTVSWTPNFLTRISTFKHQNEVEIRPLRSKK